MPDDRRATAYHEAGHAVASFYLDVPGPLVSVTIESPDGGSDPTHCQGSIDAKQAVNRPLVQDLMVQRMAGRQAEERATGRSCRDGAADDYLRAKKEAVDAGLYVEGRNSASAFWREQEEHARRFVDKHWHEIVAIAEALIKHTRLWREDVQRAISTAGRE
jgi:ATP-dependent Zn protease